MRLLARLQALLTFDKNDFTFPPLVRSLLDIITREGGRVRAAAIEAMAVVDKAMDSHLGGLLSSAGAPEAVRRELEERFRAGHLPTVGPEGLLEPAVRAPTPTPPCPTPTRMLR